MSSKMEKDPRLIHSLWMSSAEMSIPRDDRDMPNTFTSLRYHIIFSTKNREPFLVAPLLERMHAYLGGCLRTIGGVTQEIGGISDHVHILAGLKPTHCIADVMCKIKKASSGWVRNEMGLSPFHGNVVYSALAFG